MLPKFEGPPVGLGRDICGFIIAEARSRDPNGGSAMVRCPSSEAEVTHTAPRCWQEDKKPGLVGR